MTTESPFAMRARARKAAAMVAWLRRAEPDEDDGDLIAALSGWDDRQWQTLAQVAGCNAEEPPSHITRAMTLGLLESPHFAALAIPTREKAAQ